jgi:hypothetical protein
MVGGRPNSVIFWQRKRFSSAGGFNGQIVGVDRSKLLLEQQRLQLFSLFLVGLCAFGFQLSLDEAKAEPTPVPSTTPAATAAAGSSTATPTPSPEPPAVRWVGLYDSGGEKRKALKAYAGRGDEIWVDVINFEAWRNDLKDEKSKKLNPNDLILYLNHVPLKGIHPFYWYEIEWEIAPSVKTTATTLGFSLVRNEESKLGWSHLLNKPGFNRKVVVSVGFENGDEIRSELTPDETSNIKRLQELQDQRKPIVSDLSSFDRQKLEDIDKKVEVETSPKNLKDLQDKRDLILSSSDLSDPDKQKLKDIYANLDRLRDQHFYLTIIPKFSTAIGLTVILSALIAFLALARHTPIIRDPAAARRPDGKRPYSLARGQMAFWFFLVIAAYFFLWIVTGDMDTLNASVLALIGISAGTALGSAFVDAAKTAPTSSSGNQPIVDVTQPHNEVLAELKQLQADTQQELEALQKARTLISPSDKPALDDNEQQQNEVRKRLANYRWQSAYFGWPTWRGVMYDLLAENNQISFHRFQIFVWTLILGIIFVVNVYNELAMPEFSATLLGLLGVSAGTYIGFKLPEAKTR